MAERVLVHDISYWQGDLTKYWDLFKAAGCKAIIIQSTNGLAYQSYFVYAANEAKERGFLVGSYHYYRQHIQNTEGQWYTCDPLKQAQNYFNWVEKCGVAMDLPPALDVENGSNPQGVSSNGVDKTLVYIEKLFKRTPMLYSSPSILKGIIKPTWNHYPLWLAHYADAPAIPLPWKTFTLWQYSDDLTYNGKTIDHNWFNGSMADLYEFCYVEGEPNMPDEPTEKYVRVKVPWLRLRSKPELYPGDTLVIGKGVILHVTGEKVQADIDYWPVELDGYQGYVSAGVAYTQLV